MSEVRLYLSGTGDDVVVDRHGYEVQQRVRAAQRLHPGVPVTKPLGVPVINPLGVPVNNPLGVPVINPLGVPVINPLGVPVINPLGVHVINLLGVHVSVAACPHPPAPASGCAILGLGERRRA